LLKDKESDNSGSKLYISKSLDLKSSSTYAIKHIGNSVTTKWSAGQGVFITLQTACDANNVYRLLHRRHSTTNLCTTMPFNAKEIYNSQDCHKVLQLKLENKNL